MTTWMTLLIVFLAASLAAGSILTTVMAYRLQVKWMRIFCEKQGIPAITMEAKSTPDPAKVPEKPRPHVLVQVPGMAMFKPRTEQKQ